MSRYLKSNKAGTSPCSDVLKNLARTESAILLLNESELRVQPTFWCLVSDCDTPLALTPLFPSGLRPCGNLWIVVGAQGRKFFGDLSIASLGIVRAILKFVAKSFQLLSDMAYMNQLMAECDSEDILKRLLTGLKVFAQASDTNTDNNQDIRIIESDIEQQTV